MKHMYVFTNPDGPRGHLGFCLGCDRDLEPNEKFLASLDQEMHDTGICKDCLTIALEEINERPRD